MASANMNSLRLRVTPKELGKAIGAGIDMGLWTDLFSLGHMHVAALRKLVSGEGLHKFDDDSAAIVLAETEALAKKLYEECQATTVLEQMVIQRVVMSYLQLTLAEYEYFVCVVPMTSLKAREHKLKVLSTASSEFLRNVRALKDLKTVPMKLTIRDAAQVNVGQQQVNVADTKQAKGCQQPRVEVLDAQRSEEQ